MLITTDACMRTTAPSSVAHPPTHLPTNRICPVVLRLPCKARLSAVAAMPGCAGRSYSHAVLYRSAMQPHRAVQIGHAVVHCWAATQCTAPHMHRQPHRGHHRGGCGQVTSMRQRCGPKASAARCTGLPPRCLEQAACCDPTPPQPAQTRAMYVHGTAPITLPETRPRHQAAGRHVQGTARPTYRYVPTWSF